MPEDVPSLIGIKARVSPLDTATCRLKITRSILAGGPVALGEADAALVAQLREFGGVTDAVVADEVVTVRKVADADWNALVPPLAQAIRDYLANDYETVDRTAPPPVGARDDAQILDTARQAVEREFNPAIASHRGAVRVLDYAEGRLTVEMLGGCQGCAASQMTLSRGLRQLIARAVPEVREIVDATDHAAGRDPYYRD